MYMMPEDVPMKIEAPNSRLRLKLTALLSSSVTAHLTKLRHRAAKEDMARMTEKKSSSA